jgi:hypothetical protein
VTGGGEVTAGETHANTTRTTEQLQTAVETAAKALVNDSASLASNLAYDAQNNYENSFTVGASDSSEDRLQRSAEEVVQKTRGFERADQFAERFGGGMSVGGEIVAERLANDPQAMARAEHLFGTIYGGYAGELSQRQQMYERVLPSGNARALAMASLLTGIGDKSMHNRMTADERLTAAQHGWSLIDQAVGTGVPDGVNPYRNEGAGAGAPSFGEMPARVDGALDEGLRRRHEGLDEYASRMVEQRQAGVSRGPALVEARNELALADTHLAGAEDRMEQAAESRGIWEQRVEMEAERQATVPQTAAELQARLFNFLGTALEQMSGGAQAAFGAVMDAHSQGRSWGEAIQQAGPAWTAHRDEIIDRALDNVRGAGDARLTDAQLGYYGAIIREQLGRTESAGLSAVAPDGVGALDGLWRGSANSREEAEARQRVIDEQDNPQTGENIAELIERAASIQEGGALRTVRGFNMHDSEYDEAKADADKARIDKAMAEEKLEGLGLGSTGTSATDGVAMRLEAPGDLPEHFWRLEAEHGLPQGWLTANASVESSFSNNARSDAGAVGMHQFTEATARDYNLRDRTDPYESARAAAEYFRDLHDRFGSWEHAVAAYNLGPNGLERRLAEGRALPEETQQHVPKFFAALEQANTPVGSRVASSDGSPETAGLRADPGQGKLQFQDPEEDRLDPAFRQSLLAASAQLGRPLYITDGFRDPNAGYGAKDSFHKRGMAADISMRGMSTEERRDLVEALIDNGVTRFALYSNTEHLHADVGGRDIHFMYDNGPGNATVRNMAQAPSWAQDLWRKYS